MADAIIDVVRKFGGVMTKEDLANHMSNFEEPISVEYKGCRLWEMPPNGHGMVALIAINILEQCDIAGMTTNKNNMYCCTFR